MSFVNRKEVRRSNTLMALEASIVGYILYLTLGVVNKTTLSPAPALGDLVLYIGLFTSLVILSALSVGLYESKLRETFRGIIRRIFVSVALGYFLMEIIVNTVLTDIQLHQYFLPIAAGLSIITLVIFRYFINHLGLLGLGKTKIIIIGAGKRASIIERRMRREVDRFGFELLGFIPIPGDNREEGIQNEKLIHIKIDENFRNFITDNDIEEVIIACDERRGTCRLRGVEVTDLLDFMERETGQIVVNLLYPSWVIYSNGFNSQNHLKDALYYMMNTVLAFVVFMLAWPFMLLTGLIIYLEDCNKIKSSVFYKQERVGLNGKLFDIIKFRSMRPDAEKDGAKWATANDTRVAKCHLSARALKDLNLLNNLFAKYPITTRGIM
jgi:hypothetical protein